MKTTLSQNEINARSAQFAQNWKDTTREEADAQAFLIDFFNVLGINRKQVAVFEHQVSCLDGGKGYIDLLWKGKILIEMKSRGKDLSKAYEQARRYAETLSHYETPDVILICDFENWHFYDMKRGGECIQFRLEQLQEHIHLFYYLAGYEESIRQPELPVNVQAAELLGKLYDRLKDARYPERDSEILLVRILFCLFSDDTGIFERDLFHNYIETRTAQDGSDLGVKLAELFQVLNTPVSHRMSTLDCVLNKFPYINGGVFARPIYLAAFDSKMRDQLLQCCVLDWSKISPAIFGAMFQSVMNNELRRRLGVHYTSEENILKVIKPLFLDSLYDEFEKLRMLKTNKEKKLREFHEKIASLTFLDPACGCGNFLIIAYRELRLLELQLIKEIKTDNQLLLDATELCKISVAQFYGIEIEAFPTQIARVAMWLMDHLMNIEISNYFGRTYTRIPLTDNSSNIVCANALSIDWNSVVSNEKLRYILGNPPFIGARMMPQGCTQKKEVEKLFGDIKDVQDLDYVTCWYIKSAQYIQGTHIEVAFVSTNSICQGSQVSILWGVLLRDYGIKLNFAHRTFKWSNEARGKAAVYCVIVGFSLRERKVKQLYSYLNIQGEPEEKLVTSISPYLHAGTCMYVEARKKPLCDVPEIRNGSQPRDDKHFQLTPDDRERILALEPKLDSVIRPYIGAKEFLHGKQRYCIWLHNEPFDIMRDSKILKERIAAVEAVRLASSAKTTRDYAKTPAIFAQIAHPYSDYLIVPRVSSENRLYIPIGFMNERVIASDAAQIIPNASLFHFGVLSSSMHMAWMRMVAGRLESRYRYSKEIVYNTFPWPECGDKERKSIEKAASAVLAEREKLKGNTLAELYDPILMKTTPLYKAHLKLDAVVDKAYGLKFSNDMERVEQLLKMYSRLIKSE